MVFQKKGCLVEACETAEDGLALMESENFDVVISDFRLPGIDGLEFLKQAGENQPQSVRALVTAYRDYGLSKRAYDGGVHLFYEKPFSLKLITDALGDLLDSRKANGGIPFADNPAKYNIPKVSCEVNASS
jgi:DNA-binding NtrC family response regulator